jgi:predicted nucleic acid-binding protein
VLLDSNIFIYAVQPDYTQLRQWIINKDIAASEISRVEVLGYSQLTNEDTKDFEELFNLAKIQPVSRAVIDQAIILRRQHKISLGDALIAATAQVYKLTLVTRNTDDFDWIDGLPLINPIDQKI